MNNLYKRILLSSFLLITNVVLHITVFGLDVTQIRFDVIDIKQGLSQNSVSHIYQDSKGYMWFCTDEGLNRYDGYSFLKLERIIGNENSLISNFTTCITESKPGIFWIGTETGLSVYLFDEKKFLHVENRGQITKIFVEDSFSVWIQTQYSLYKIRLVANNKNANDYTLNIEPLNALKSVICKLDVNHFLIAGRDNKLYLYDIRTKLLQNKGKYDIWKIIIPKHINDVIKDWENNFWVATNAGLFKVNSQQNSIDSFSENRKSIHGLNERITDVAVGKMGNIYIATAKNGLVMYEAEKNKFNEYQSDPYNTTSLPDNKILSLLTDNSNTLWVGTKGAGIATFSQFKYKFKHITQEIFKTTWLTNKYILSLVADKNENIWIGTDGGGLFKFNAKENIFSNWRYNRLASSLTDDVVQEVLFDANDNLWVNTLNGICKYNPNNNKFTRYSLPYTKAKESISKVSNYSNVLLFSSKSGDFYALDEQTIFKFNYLLNQFEALPIPVANQNFIPRKIIEDIDNTWWLATSVGIIHIDLNTGILQKDALNAINNKFFKNDQLYCLLQHDEDRIWVGSGNNGLFLFNKKKMQIEANYTEKDGMSNNFVYGILKDKVGKIWMSTNSGITVFDPILKQFRTFDINDGLQSNEFNRGAYYKTANNELLFGGINGFNIISPTSIPFNNYKPLANITGIKVNDSLLLPLAYSNQSKRIRFANSQNNISFEFASSDYANTPKNVFEYKLEGYEKNWTRTRRNHATYTKLSPGNYTFYVRVSNNDGLWSAQPAAYSFRVRPLIWQTWWFKIIAGILFLLYAYQLVSNRIQAARKKEKEKTQLAQQKAEFEKQLAEIKLKSLVAQMNPHFIFNCMNSIQAMILSDQNMQASTYLTKLSRLVRSLLENSVNTFIPLSDVIENLKLYLELESLRFDQRFNYDIRTENLDIYAIEMPSMLIQPYVENSIWHGLIKKEGEKNIQIKFYKNYNYLICEITDNGIGREKAAALNLKKQHKSLGTIITKEMFETLHKIKETDYSVEIIDLYDKQHQPAGTKVWIRIELN